MNKFFRFFFPVILIIGFTRCTNSTSETLFLQVSSQKTNLFFKNEVTQTRENNILNYSYFFNGGGVAVGDFNNDGLEDIYFTGNQVSNKLYLNKGNLTFEDITEKAGVAANEGWKTGVALADVNMDGWLDIYVCRSAMSDSTLRNNLLFLNNQNLTFTERAAEYGIDDNTYSTHAAFFDYDNDNDLDLFLLNHSLPRYAGFSKLLTGLKKQKGDKYGSRLYNNQNGKFDNVTEKAGLINNVLSFGLGLGISDLNRDGFLDIYVSNDFNEEDYLYMNNQDGTFTNKITEATDHVSLFSMGSDIADINNDGLSDIYTLDMLPASNERIKLSSGDDNYDKFQLLIGAGFHNQTVRNMLQLNNSDGTFSEIGQLAGVSNTDWSWAALFNDFDGDGWKDLFVSNGYEKDYTNMQFLKFTVDEQLKSRKTGVPLDLQLIINNMPTINEGNFLFKNNGDLTFSNKTADWGIKTKEKTSGAAYADFDNDGDQDLVVNAMNATALFYKNTSADQKLANYVKVDLVKNNRGENVIGSKVEVYIAGHSQFLEFTGVHGYESCMLSPLSIGLGNVNRIDSLIILWPNGSQQKFLNIKADSVLAPAMKQSRSIIKAQSIDDPLFEKQNLVNWAHQPAPVNDFKRQQLLPHMYSFSGPKMATGDLNHDGLSDVFVGGAKGQASTIFFQQKNGSFQNQFATALVTDKDYQDEDATFFDADGDNDLDLYVVSGGYLFENNDPMLQDRLYLNDSKGNFTRAMNSIPIETEAGAVVVSIDVDNDRDMDLFIGGRITPAQYPKAPKSIILINDGSGNFSNKTTEIANGLSTPGMISDAKVVDLNTDGWLDLIVAGEWLPIQVWINHEGEFSNQTANWFRYPNSGWWNCLQLEDFDNDGDLDLVAGNAGTNNQFNVSPKSPATLVYKDFNNDNQVDPFFCYFIKGKSYPYASRDEALGQVNFLKPRFPDYLSYANAAIQDIFTPQELQDTVVLKANELNTCLFENKGSFFEKKILPTQAQWAPIYAITSIDVNQDGLKDILMGGNESYVRVRLGRNSSSRGIVFINKGKVEFEFLPNLKSGIVLQGDVRDIQVVQSASATIVFSGSIGNSIQSFVLKTWGLKN